MVSPPGHRPGARLGAVRHFCTFKNGCVDNRIDAVPAERWAKKNPFTWNGLRVLCVGRCKRGGFVAA
jgi:hypothetical protein